MGQRIVKNLLESGHNVSIWNRTLDKCTPFVKAGAHKFLTPCDVVLNCDIIFCCVSGPEATKSVVFGNRGILQGFQKCKPATKLFVVLSALDLQTSKELNSAVTSEGGNYLDAPISGSISDAEAGTLLIIVAGEREFFNDCVTCFYAMSRHAYHLGSDIGNASIMHVCTSMVNYIPTVAMAEAMSLVESVGISKNSLQKHVNFSSMNCPLFREKGMAMATNNFTTNHSLKYQHSDLQILLKTSDAYAHPVPLAAAANEVFKRATQLKYSDHDVSAVYFGELWFQQDGATCHTARATIDLLKDTFGDRLISRFGPVNWPPRSCDLTPLDYFLWGYVKSLINADKPQTLDHLEDNIRRVIADIRPQMLEKVIENWTSRLDYIRASRGSPIPEIIFKI
ncbi:putative oxidoreductase GLYR1 homolog [Trichonephila clavipes]|nr:putative oxidoreductase GLYR1 homolog [Trichonephila clavipes]